MLLRLAPLCQRTPVRARGRLLEAARPQLGFAHLTLLTYYGFFSLFPLLLVMTRGSDWQRFSPRLWSSEYFCRT
ncbi:MAG: hypothetical protein ACXVFF_12360, partial [Gaiellaceae bacterium]